MRSIGTKIRELALVLLSVIGFADVLFLYVQEEKGTVGQFCEAVAGSFGANCETVLTSKYAELAGVPLTVWGMVYYLSLVWIASWARVESDRGGGRAARILLSLLSGPGFLVSIYLTYLQASVLHAWCPFCLASAVLTALILILSVWGAFRSSAPRGEPPPVQTSDLAVPPASVPGSSSQGIGALVLLCVLLMGGLITVLLSRAPDPPVSALEKMMPYVPRRNTPAGGLIYGSDTAPVVVQAFLDYTCQHCRAFESEVFPKIQIQYIRPGRVKWISKVLPHSDQGAAMFFAMAGICGRSTPDSGQIDRSMFAYPIPSPKSGFDALADALSAGGVDTGAFAEVRRCMETRTDEIQKQVILEVQQAFWYGLKGPPAFVIDGIAYQGSMDYRTMSDLLDIFIKQHGS